jgi:hypothetical protein
MDEQTPTVITTRLEITRLLREAIALLDRDRPFSFDDMRKLGDINTEIEVSITDLYDYSHD